MTFSMYMGFVTGMLTGAIGALIAIRARKKKSGIIEDDERTQLITGRASSLTLTCLAIFAFVAWVAENVLRNMDGLAVRFFSPWSILLFAGFILYMGLWYFESRKVSDPDAEPSEQEKRKLQAALGVICCSLVTLTAVFASTSDRMSRSVLIFLGGFELLLLVGLGFVFGKMYFRRKKA